MPPMELSALPLSRKDSLDSLLDPKLYIGRCPEQVTSFLKNDVEPVLKMYGEYLDMEAPELNV